MWLALIQDKTSLVCRLYNSLVHCTWCFNRHSYSSTFYFCKNETPHMWSRVWVVYKSFSHGFSVSRTNCSFCRRMTCFYSCLTLPCILNSGDWWPVGWVQATVAYALILILIQPAGLHSQILFRDCCSLEYEHLRNAHRWNMSFGHKAIKEPTPRRSCV